MKILIIGNIGSGKTTLGKKIQEITGYKFVQIDALREHYLKNTVSGEYLSLLKFLKLIERKESMIFEFTGVGCHKYAVKRALQLTSHKILVIHCKNRVFDQIIERVNKKTFNYRNIFDIDIKTHIYFIEKELKKDISKKFWKLANSKFREIFMDNFNDLNYNISTLMKELIVDKNQIKPKPEEKMKVNKWREGINLSIDNVLQLVNDGKMLMEKGSYGHACFFFLTAFEETAVAYFIIDNFDTPLPKKLHKKEFLNHLKKFSLARFKTFLISGDLSSFNDFLTILREQIQNGAIKNYESKLRNLEKKIQKGNSFWNFRNNCIYTSLDQRTLQYISPKDIDQKTSVNLYKMLIFLVTYLQIHRDVIFEYGPKYIKYTMEDLRIYESLENLFELIRIISEKSMSKLEESLKPNTKLLQIIKDFNEDTGKPLDIPKFNDFLNLLMKDFALNIVQMEKKENKELIQFVLERLKIYNPEFPEAYTMALEIYHKISENKFNIEDYPDLLEGIRENIRRLKYREKIK